LGKQRSGVLCNGERTCGSRKRGDEKSFRNHMVMRRCDERVLATTWLGKEVMKIV
jgi:hypothetical protein